MGSTDYGRQIRHICRFLVVDKRVDLDCDSLNMWSLRTRQNIDMRAKIGFFLFSVIVFSNASNASEFKKTLEQATNGDAEAVDQ